LPTSSSPSTVHSLPHTTTPAPLLPPVCDCGSLSQHVDFASSFFPAVQIADSPRFPYRGLMVDPARRFLPVSLLQAVVDSMSYAKLNVLHLHMTDDQSWPWDVQAFPDLARKGAFSFPSHTYNVTQLKGLVDYARLRGVRVVLEVDTPGHSSILALAMPSVLTHCPGQAPYGLDFANLDPTRNSTFDYLRKLFAEAVTIFSDDYLFLGGDEVSTGCWAANTNVTAWLAARGMPLDASTLQAYYEQRVVELVRSDPNIRKEVVVWQEVFQTAADPVATLGTSAVVDVWKGGGGASDVLAAVTAKGLGAMVSHCWYLDMINGDTAWGREFLSYYACDPQDFAGTDEQKARVLGGHGCIWGEATDASNLMPAVWPRMAAAAERLWSPRNRSQDTQDFARRLHVHRCRLLNRGIASAPVGTLGDPAVPDELTIGPGSRTYCEADAQFAYAVPY
jgi:hexosaminidase